MTLTAHGQPPVCAPASAPSLVLRGIGCEKGNETLFADISLELAAGEMLHVCGANGSGKTSLLRIIAGLASSYHGELLWQGEDVRGIWPVYAQSLIYLGHTPALKARLTARENLEWYARCAGATPQQAFQALAALGLRHRADIPCHMLSAGQQRRVALARLFFSTQPLWILDEPFTAIDVDGFAPLAACLGAHLQRGGLLVLTTHHGIERLQLPYRELSLSPLDVGEAA